MSNSIFSRINWSAVAGGLAGSGFGAWWAATGIASLTPSWAPRIAILAVAALLFAAFAGRFALPGAPRRRIDPSWMAAATIGEVLFIGLGVSLAVHLGRSDLALPAVALAVGMHFFPIARATGYAPYAATGAAITVVALASLAVTDPLRTALLGCGTASCLWLTIVAGILTGRPDRRAGRMRLNADIPT